MLKNVNHFFHPWHSLETGKEVPAQVNAIIEITQGSKAKYELDKETGFLRLDRVLGCNLSYPFHYGYIPQTYCADNDPLDILVLCSEQLLPLSIVETTVLGAVEMIDNGEQDDKIIAVATNDPYKKQFRELKNLDPAILHSIKFFFEEYKKPEGKHVVINRFLDRTQAYALIENASALYKKTYKEL